MTHTLTPDEAIRINALLGEGAVLRDRGLLESAVARPAASAYGTEAYPTVEEKAAALFHSIVLNHPFLDGNKRTGTVAMIYFLEQNGVRPAWDPADAFRVVVATAEGKLDVPEIAAWLREHTSPA